MVHVICAVTNPLVTYAYGGRAALRAPSCALLREAAAMLGDASLRARLPRAPSAAAV